MIIFPMEPENDFALAKTIATKLNGKFWQVTLGDWWVTVEGVSAQRLVIFTNDPFGVTFTPRELTIGLQDLKKRVMLVLVEQGVVYEDGSWSQASA